MQTKTMKAGPAPNDRAILRNRSDDITRNDSGMGLIRTSGVHFFSVWEGDVKLPGMRGQTRKSDRRKA